MTIEQFLVLGFGLSLICISLCIILLVILLD